MKPNAERVRRLVLLHLSALALAASVSPAHAAPASAWSPRARSRMVEDALKVAPPVLSHLILKHADSLQAGLDEATLTEGSAQHRQDSGDPSAGAAAAMEIVAGKAVAALDGHRPMRDLVFYLGVLAHLAADVSDPLLTAAEGASAAFAPDYPAYVERNLDRFPAVFYGYEGGTASLEDEAIAAAKLSRDYYGHLARAYAATGGSSASFDVRSIPFGVASLSYSRAVTGIARAWLHVWLRAHGDVTGTRYLDPTAAAAPVRSTAPPAGAAARSPAARPGATAAEGTTIRPGPIDPAAAIGNPGGGSGADPNGAPITKTIIGKSRKRMSSASGHPPGEPAPSRVAGSDPNKPADPNS